MKTLLLLAALSTASPAFAGTLPITGVYGNDEGCSLFAKGGAEAVFYDASPDGVIAQPTGLIGLEMECTPSASGHGVFSVDCGEATDDLTLTLAFDQSTDTITADTPSGPEALHRCPTNETPLM